MRNAISFLFRSLTYCGPDRYVRLIKSTEHYLKNCERIYRYVNIMSYRYLYKIMNITHQKTWIVRVRIIHFIKITWIWKNFVERRGFNRIKIYQRLTGLIVHEVPITMHQICYCARHLGQDLKAKCNL